ncbi:hypothetical protein ACWKT5_24635 [Streptomyces avermitilis]
MTASSKKHSLTAPTRSTSPRLFELDKKKAKVNGKEVVFRGGKATGVFRKRLHEIP